MLMVPSPPMQEVGDDKLHVVNAELNCHFFTDADVPRLTNSLFLAPDTLLVVPGSYAVLSPDDLAESRAGAAVVFCLDLDSWWPVGPTFWVFRREPAPYRKRFIGLNYRVVP